MSDPHRPFQPPVPAGESSRAGAWAPPTVSSPPAEPVAAPPYAGQAPSPPASGAALGGHVAVAARHGINSAVVAIAWIVAVLTFGYMLPWAIAATRGKANHGAIAVLNVLLGWTVIGWIVALVMACQDHAPAGVGAVAQSTVVVQNFVNSPQTSLTGSPPAGWYPDPDGGGRRYWDGQAWTEHRAP